MKLKKNVKLKEIFDTVVIFRRSLIFQTKEFFQNSTLHGVRYIAETGRPVGEKWVFQDEIMTKNIFVDFSESLYIHILMDLNFVKPFIGFTFCLSAEFTKKKELTNKKSIVGCANFEKKQRIILCHLWMDLYCTSSHLT